METIVTPQTAQRWASALERAISEALDVLVDTSGCAYVESGSQPGLLYIVTRDSCSCPAGEQGKPCKHRAVFLAQIGELEIDPEPDRITFSGNRDRVEVLVDGRHHGFAAYTDDSGWTFFTGRFPHARRRGTFATVEELRAHLVAHLPVTLPVLPAADLALVAA